MALSISARAVSRSAPAQGGVGAEQLRPAVRPSGVGVHNAPGQLHQLADVAHQQDGGEPLRSGSVQGLP